MKKKIVLIGLLGPGSFPASSNTRMTREEKSKRYGPWLFQSLWVLGSLSITNVNAS
jgi:hypothetical protein